MKHSIFLEKNLRMPEEIFNKLGNKKFKKEWTKLPLQILKNRQTSKTKNAKYLRNEYLADVIYKQFVEHINKPTVVKYVRKKQNEEPVIWSGERCSVERRNFMLIDQEIHPEHGPMDIDYMEFWIEEKEDDSYLKTSDKRTKHNKAFMLSIFDDVLKTIDGKITHKNYAYYLEKFLKDSEVFAPKDTWIGNHLSEEIKAENVRRGFA
jgi:hypothetical protein